MREKGNGLAKNPVKAFPIKAAATLAAIAICLIALNLAGRDLLQQSLSEISRASAKQLVDLSNPVMPWERELYEKYTLNRWTEPQLKSELSKVWETSPKVDDVIAWVARMKIYANFLDVFGFLLYFPGPMWFRVAWELYGEPALLISIILLVASPTKNTHLRHVSVIASAGIAALYVLVSAPVRHSVLGTDIILNPVGWNFHEWYLRQSIVKWGEIPLWFRYKYSGSPYLSDPQMIVYYPSTIILALAPNEMVGIRYAILLHVIMSGISMYFLMNVWRQKPEASLAAGVGYMLGGFTYAKIQAGFPTFIYPYAWMPLVLAFLDLSFKRRSVKYAALAGLSLATQMQSGIIIALYTLILLALYGLTKLCITLARHIRKPRGLLSHVGEAAKISMVFAVFAALISASKVLPTLEILPYLDRGGPLPETELFRGVIPDLSQLIQVLTFRPRGLDLEFPAWGAEPLPYHWHEYWSYTGVLLPLAVCSLRFYRRNEIVIPLAITTVLSALWSMGILYQPLLDTVPFLTLTRVPSRLLVLAQFAIPALAAATVTNVQTWLADKFESDHPNLRLRGLRPDRLFALLVVAIVFVDLATAGASLVRTVEVTPTASPAMNYAMQDSTRDVFRVYTTVGGRPPNVYTYSVQGLETTWLSAAPDLSYDSWEFSINAYSRYHRLAQETTSYKMMGMLNVKYVITNIPQETDSELELVRSFDEKESLYSNPFYMSRIQYVEHGLLVLCSDDDRWESVSTGTILRETFDPTSLLIVRAGYLDEFTLDDLRRFGAIQIGDGSDPPAHDAKRAKELLENYISEGGVVIRTGEAPDSLLEKLTSKSKTPEVTITRYTSNSLEAKVTTENRGFIFISEIYIPGWRVRVDDMETKVLQTDNIFIGTILDAGTHSLRIEFKPYSYDLGLASTVLGLIGVIVSFSTGRIKATFRRIRRLRESKPSPNPTACST